MNSKSIRYHNTETVVAEFFCDTEEFSDDNFDTLPDPIILTIFNRISDIKTLTRLRLVSRRFNSLIPQSDSLSLRVDRVISSADSDNDCESSSVFNFFKSLVKTLHDFITSNESSSSNSTESTRSTRNESPAVILRGFDRIQELQIELPNGDLKVEKRAVIRWTAEFGRNLNSLVILGFRHGGVTEGELGGGGGLKTRVVWTISSLIAASARHYMVKEIIKENLNLKKLIVKDRENEGNVIMNELGINEFRNEENEIKIENEENEGGGGGGGVWWRSNRTRVPAVWMRMRHEAKLELSNGVTMEGATLVVVRPTNGNGEEGGEGDEGLVANRFEGVYGEAVAKLIKRRSYLLEMNSF